MGASTAESRVLSHALAAAAKATEAAGMSYGKDSGRAAVRKQVLELLKKGASWFGRRPASPASSP